MDAAGRNYLAALEAYEAMVSARPGIDRKGKKIPYTSMNGNMFSFLDGNGTICLRLSGDDQGEFHQDIQDATCRTIRQTDEGICQYPG